MELARQILSVCLVFLLMAALLWYLRRHGQAGFGAAAARRGGRLAEPIERVPLGPQHALQLVRVANRVLVVAVHSSGCTLLETLPWQEFVEASRKPVSGEDRS